MRFPNSFTVFQFDPVLAANCKNSGISNCSGPFAPPRNRLAVRVAWGFKSSFQGSVNIQSLQVAWCLRGRPPKPIIGSRALNPS